MDLVVSRAFAKQCLAFPDAVEKALAKIESVDDAKGMLDKASAMAEYASRLKVEAEIAKPIAVGVLKIKAKIGELMPASPPDKRGQGRSGKKSSKAALLDFPRPTIAAYRRIAKHRKQLDKFCQQCDDFPTQAAFLAHCKAIERKKKQSKKQQTVEPIEFGVVSDLTSLAGQKFGCIYADPPWKYGNQGTRAATDDHYQTMSVGELCTMPIADLAADDAHLHLWTTNAFLFTARQLLEAWGFTYKSCFVWVKPQMGIGNYWRVSHEFLLCGVRGDAKRFNDRGMKSWGEFPRGKHSAKPEEIRNLIERASHGPYLELFGRKSITGWTVFGNQVERMLT